MSHKAQVLFRRVPVLSALFMEVLTRGFLTSVLNVSYTYALREAITDDAERAGYSGIVSLCVSSYFIYFLWSYKNFQRTQFFE